MVNLLSQLISEQVTLFDLLEHFTKTRTKVCPLVVTRVWGIVVIIMYYWLSNKLIISQHNEYHYSHGGMIWTIIYKEKSPFLYV